MNDFCVNHNIFHPHCSCDELDEIVRDPFAWFARQKKSRHHYEGYKYLLTFTRNPNSRYSIQEWLKRIKKEIIRRSFSEQHCSLEHPDTNIHIHAVVNSNKPIAKSLFKVFSRDYGYVDVRRINIDNGVLDYIQKELPNSQTPMDISEFSKFNLDI